MDVEEFLRAAFDDHVAVAQATPDQVATPMAELVSLCATAISGGGKLMFFGNGGSAADAQHLAAELVVRYAKDRAPVAAVALSTDTSILTAAGNDYGYEHVFARQVRSLGKPGDVALGISTSGNSNNVVAALEAAKDMGMTAAAFSGASGGKLVGLADPLILVPSTDTARIQEMHITLGHILCAGLETQLGLI
jgi:D-sedoheptulose 7-phosphate isomerase